MFLLGYVIGKENQQKCEAGILGKWLSMVVVCLLYQCRIQMIGGDEAMRVMR